MTAGAIAPGGAPRRAEPSTFQFSAHALSRRGHIEASTERLALPGDSATFRVGPSIRESHRPLCETAGMGAALTFHSLLKPAPRGQAQS
ncbi:MAG TPA: hypothetical protein DGT21_07805 [Armatimonadetes bacterium]|nr:hypothetical protein [Armatimonadota bacterium]